MLFLAWISAACVPKDLDGFNGDHASKSTQGAFLFFTIVGWLFSIFIFAYNIVNVDIRFLAVFKKVPWEMIVTRMKTNICWNRTLLNPRKFVSSSSRSAIAYFLYLYSPPQSLAYAEKSRSMVWPPATRAISIEEPFQRQL